MVLNLFTLKFVVKLEQLFKKRASELGFAEDLWQTSTTKCDQTPDTDGSEFVHT